MPSKVGTGSTVSGTTKVTTAQKAVKLMSAQTNVATEVLIQADPSNAGTLVAIGDASVNAKKTLGSTQGIVIEKKQGPIRFEVGDPSLLYVDVETSGDAVIWLVILA